jgi:hypothetical protein
MKIENFKKYWSIGVIEYWSNGKSTSEHMEGHP